MVRLQFHTSIGTDISNKLSHNDKSTILAQFSEVAIDKNSGLKNG